MTAHAQAISIEAPSDVYGDDCYVIRFGDIRILCGDPTMDFPGLENGNDAAKLKTFKHKSIDLFLISRPSNLGALPYLRGVNPDMDVWVTPPVAYGARVVTEEMLIEEQLEGTHEGTITHSSSSNARAHGLRAENSDKRDPCSKKRTLMSSASVIMPSFHFDDNCLTLVKYEAPGRFGGLRITAMRSGYCLGGANWVIENIPTGDRVVVVGPSSSKSTLSGVLYQRALQNATTVLVSGLNPSSVRLKTTGSMDDIGSLLDEGAFHNEIKHTLMQRGNVLIPVDNDLTKAVDIIQTLVDITSSMTDLHVPIFAFGAVGQMLLRLESLTDWMKLDSRWAVGATTSLRCPIEIDEMIRTNRLVCGDMNDIGRVYKEPCVVLALRDSLESGPASHFAHIWHAPSKIFSTIKTSCESRPPVPDKRLTPNEVKALLDGWQKANKDPMMRLVRKKEHAHIGRVLGSNQRVTLRSKEPRFVRGYFVQESADGIEYSKKQDGSYHATVTGELCLERSELVFRPIPQLKARMSYVTHALTARTIPFHFGHDGATLHIPGYGSIEFREAGDDDGHASFIIEAESRTKHKELELLLPTVCS